LCFKLQAEVGMAMMDIGENHLIQLHIGVE